MDYSLIARLRTVFSELEQQIAAMRDYFSALPLLAARLYILPPVEKGKEHDPIYQIHPEPCGGEQARSYGLAHFQHLFIHHSSGNISSKAAIRLPGALCFAVSHEEYRQARILIDRINGLKQALEQIITRESGLAPTQRFEFVHRHLPGLLTLGAYRSLTLLTEPTTVRFGWANKHFIKQLARDELLAKLEKSLNAERGIPPADKAAWTARVTQEINDVQRLPENALLKIKRPVKVQPIARVWYQEAQKQVQHPCPSPLLILCRPSAAAPVIGTLGDYDARAIRHKHKPKAKKLRLLIPRLHLYLDESAG